MWVFWVMHTAYKHKPDFSGVMCLGRQVVSLVLRLLNVNLTCCKKTKKKTNKGSASLALYHFSPTHLINSIIHNTNLSFSPNWNRLSRKMILYCCKMGLGTRKPDLLYSNNGAYQPGYLSSLISAFFYNWASAWDFQQFGMCDQQSLRSAWAYAQSDQSLCKSLEYSMTVKLLTEHHLEFLSFKEGCTGSYKSRDTCQNATLLEITCHGLICFLQSMIHKLPSYIISIF